MCDLVWYCRRSNRPATAITGIPLVFLLLLPSVVFAAAAHLMGQPVRVLLDVWPYLVIVPLVAIVLFAVVKTTRTARRLKCNTFAEVPPEARLACVGAEKDLLRYGTLQDCFFDPVVIRAAGSQPCLPIDRATRLFWTLLCVGTFYYIFIGVCGIPGSLNPFAAFTPAHGLALGFGNVVAGAVVDCLLPTYIRIVPGHLDIMRFPLLRRRSPVCMHIPLQEANILVDIDRCVAFIDYSNDGDVTSVELSLGLMRDKSFFAYMLFLAAISTSVPPSLPDGELLG